MGGYTTGLSELIIKVEDPEATARFYRDVVGLEVEVEVSETGAWFWSGEPGKSSRFAVTPWKRGTVYTQLPIEEHAPLPEPDRWKVPHFAFEVPNDQLEEAIEQIGSHGVPIHGPVTFEWMNARAYYFYDPAGHLVEFWASLD